MDKVLQVSLKLPGIPGGGSVCTEKVSTHVVVNADDVHSFFMKKPCSLTSDET
jgi:hypothetical protein